MLFKKWGGCELRLYRNKHNGINVLLKFYLNYVANN